MSVATHRSANKPTFIFMNFLLLLRRRRHRRVFERLHGLRSFVMDAAMRVLSNSQKIAYMA
jgi:hypothetical protein